MAERRLSPALSGMSREMRLLPMTSARVYRLQGRESLAILAAFAGVRLAADAVHGHGKVLCASVEIEPSDMAPVAKRLTISLADSTSSSETAGPAGFISNRPRKVMWRRPWSLISLAYSL
jgi:hypothetical protein